MTDKSVDMIFTSPPFKDEDVTGDYWVEYSKWHNEFRRIAKNIVCIIQSATRLNYLISNYPPDRTIIWGRPFSLYTWRFNPILVYQQSDGYKINKYIWSDCFGCMSIKETAHPYEDPIILYKRIIEMFKDCETVFDPFVGSGTTGVACMQLGRNFIGCEIDPGYYAIAEKRIREAA